MYKKIAISNRNIFFSYHKGSSLSDFVNHLASVCDNADVLILREKDLPLSLYRELASDLISCCKEKKSEIILHSYIECCRTLNHKKLHLPMPVFKENLTLLNDFETVGISVHSAEEAIFAQNHNASYVIYSHIFPTDCKKGLPAKGLEALENVCKSVNIPVYALGGITDANESSVIAAGAMGACRMAYYNKQRFILR